MFGLETWLCGWFCGSKIERLEAERSRLEQKLAEASDCIEKLSESLVAMSDENARLMDSLGDLKGQLQIASKSLCCHERIPFWAFILGSAAEFELDPFVVAGLLERESGWDPLVPGDGGASIGLAQAGRAAWEDMMPMVGYERARSPREAIEFACRYLAFLRDWLKMNFEVEDIKWVLAAYNAGPGTVSSIIKEHGPDWEKLSGRARSNVDAYLRHIERLKGLCDDE